MTCFWDGILKQLNKDDFTVMFGINRKLNRNEFIIQLKKNNKKCNNVLWMGKSLTKKEKEEMFEAVKDFNIHYIKNGHLTSICDYFLVLICELCKVNIIHIFIKYKIIYSNKKGVRKQLCFKSNNGHFW